MSKVKDKELFPSHSLVLDDEAQHYLATYIKMYQLFFSIDKAALYENTTYRNHFVRLWIDKDDATFPWLEFMMYEIVDLINNLHTLADGVYVTNVKTADFLKTLNFETFWEQLEDWAEYLVLEDFADKTAPHLEYIFKLFKCTEHWVDKHGSFPKLHKDELDDVMIDIDEYYAANISNAIPELKNEKEDEEITSGVIPMSDGTPNPKDNGFKGVDDTPPEDEPEDEPEEEKERSIKADIVTPKMEQHGVYTSD